jgi:EEF1A lysine methyltransferase 2
MLNSIIDLGCGNAAILLELAKNGFTHLTGIDYSAGAIELARRFAIRDGVDIKLAVRACVRA